MTATTRTRTGIAAAALALGATGLLGACGSSAGSDPVDASTTEASTTTAAGGGDTTTTTAGGGSETTTTTKAGGSGQTTTTLEDAEGVDTETSQLDTLADGDHYVYMAGLEKGKVEGQNVQVLIVDPVEMLTGQDAIDAAAEDGTTLDTDYYIRNSDQTVKRIAVVPDASVTTLADGTSGTRPSSVDEVWQQEHLFKINVGNVRGITTISSVDAVYLP
jgi:hypothetical protein